MESPRDHHRMRVAARLMGSIGIVNRRIKEYALSAARDKARLILDRNIIILQG